MAATELRQKLTFEQYLEQCPEDGRYELVNGELVRILATRQHEDVADFLTDVLKDEDKRSGEQYKVSARIALATRNKVGNDQGRHPDVGVVKREVWRSNRSAYTAFRDAIQLVIEVVSTNWEDDYIDKLDEYQRLGILEYWIVDYLALGSRTYLGNPKEPSVFVYTLDETGQYQCQRFQRNERIPSTTFPELNLTVVQILEA
ncbi:MAG: Uma2 family endonuclease [Timaviella obliquedivisa GSE-PSE-MK23-08B]|jgi:Uma2 family endonuclease|nr:Uma2 family endonuclease [Timaviella obliquedivisa GSE-PSE-MK23-08B]